MRGNSVEEATETQVVQDREQISNTKAGYHLQRNEGGTIPVRSTRELSDIQLLAIHLVSPGTEALLTGSSQQCTVCVSLNRLHSVFFSRKLLLKHGIRGASIACFLIRRQALAGE